ncbi:MAG: flippase-like domain-containing protein [Anaerolineae bacterium]|nr:flippase-like domain-containing protein [Anaerolineae bacterium]
MMKRTRRLLPYVGTLGIILLLLWQIDPRQVLRLLEGVKLEWLLVGFGWYVLTNLLRAYRFGALLALPGMLRPIRLLPEMFALSLLNNILPSRGGEISFPYLMHWGHDMGVGESAAALVVARIFDYLAVATLYILFASVEAGSLATGAMRLILVVTGLMGTSLVILALTPWLGQRGLGILRRLLDWMKLAERPVGRMAWETGQQAVVTLTRIRGFRTYMLTFVWSLLIWGCTFAWFTAFMRAIHLPYRYPLIVVGATFATLAKAIPFLTIGGFGAHEAGWAIGFSLTGLDTSTAIASGFTVDILTLIMSWIFGGPALAYAMRRKHPHRAAEY